MRVAQEYAQRLALRGRVALYRPIVHPKQHPRSVSLTVREYLQFKNANDKRTGEMLELALGLRVVRRGLSRRGWQRHNGRVCYTHTRFVQACIQAILPARF